MLRVCVCWSEAGGSHASGWGVMGRWDGGYNGKEAGVVLTWVVAAGVENRCIWR